MNIWLLLVRIKKRLFHNKSTPWLLNSFIRSKNSQRTQNFGTMSHWSIIVIFLFSNSVSNVFNLLFGMIENRGSWKVNTSFSHRSAKLPAIFSNASDRLALIKLIKKCTLATPLKETQLNYTSVSDWNKNFICRKFGCMDI